MLRKFKSRFDDAICSASSWFLVVSITCVIHVTSSVPSEEVDRVPSERLFESHEGKKERSVPFSRGNEVGFI